MAAGIDGNADGLTGRNRPHRQVSGEMQALAIVTGADRPRQLRRLSRHRTEAELAAFS